jgi:class 3 adenylate cyclase
LGLTLEDVGHPAYLVDHDFRIVWANDEARISALSPLTDRPGGRTGNVFGLLLQLADGPARAAILRLHLQLARERAAGLDALLRDLPPAQADELQALYRQAQRPQPGLVSQAPIPASGSAPARRLYAIRFREGVLFAYVAGELAEETTPLLKRRPVPAAPVLTPVAVLVTTLQDAAGLWVRLSAQEYFELLNDIWAELDRIFRQHQGRARPQAGEALACYFLPQAEGNYLWNALAAAQQTREAMRQVSQRWQARKGWDLELCMNTGIDDGQDWLGALGSGPDADLVLGDAPERAEQLARCSRQGAVLVTRSLLGKLPGPEARRLKYAVPRFDVPGGEGRLLSTFARLGDIAGPAAVPARFADLAVAELLDLDLLPNPTLTSAPRAEG